MSDVMNYDPNLLTCGRIATQTVKLTFGDWTYRAEMTVQCGGNLRGFEVIRYAIELAFDELAGKKKFATLVMKDANGDTLTDDQGVDEDWLANKLVKAEIVAIEPREWNP